MNSRLVMDEEQVSRKRSQDILFDDCVQMNCVVKINLKMLIIIFIVTIILAFKIILLISRLIKW